MTSKAELVRTNLVHATEKHRGIDGRMRFLCGPGISILSSSRSTYIVPAKRPKQKSQIQHYGNGGKCGAALMFLIYHAKNREEEVVDPCMD